MPVIGPTAPREKAADHFNSGFPTLPWTLTIRVEETRNGLRPGRHSADLS
jgi:hypothetical protein